MTQREYGPISSPVQLENVREEIEKEYGGTTLLYRGQCNLYPKIRSGRARSNTSKSSAALESGWLSLASLILDSSQKEQDQETEKEQDPGLAKAILQHYGSPTYFVDLTSDIGVASWFATHSYHEQDTTWAGNAFRFIKQARYEQRAEGTGYVLVLGVDANTLSRRGFLYDLSCLPEEVTRPHRQKGWLMLDRPPMLPTPNDFWIATININCAEFKHPAILETLFPPPREDRAYAAIRGLPFVQIPAEYFRREREKDSTVEEKQEKRPQSLDREKFCFATRAIDVCDYGHVLDRANYDHKWEDYTLYEPHPMRMWKDWRFDLETFHEGIRGNIGMATKITISPRAFKVLKTIKDAPCEWLDLGSSDLFFTFAALDHDKIEEHSPPYDGVWIHRSDEFLLETPMRADHQVLNVHGGHGYLFRDGDVQRQEIAHSCVCNDPESHDDRIRTVLRISALVEAQILILVPHPRIADWYIVL